MKTFKQFLEQRFGTLPTVGALGGIVTGAAMYSALQPHEKQPQEKQPQVTSEPSSTPTVSFTVQPSPDKGNPPKVLSDSLDPIKRRNDALEPLIKTIKEKEGFEENAYICPAGTCTIGYGSTFHFDDEGNIIKIPHPTEKGKFINKTITMGETITKPKAEHYVRSHIRNEIQKPLEKQLPTIFDFKHNHDVHPAVISTLFDLAYNNGDSVIWFHGKNKKGNIVGDSVAQHLIAANKATEPETRLNHIIEGLHGTLDFHKLREKKEGPLVPNLGLLNRRMENLTHTFGRLHADGHITQEQHEANMTRARNRYKEILATIGK